MSYCEGWNIIVFDELDSTNAEAKRRAIEGLTDDTVFIAHAQTAGRGRIGRKWESPNDAGLWMTQLFRADKPEGAVFIAAVAMARTIAGSQIKWPNDIVMNGKKICGMLAECGFDANGCWIALGAGLNLTKDALPKDLIYASSVEAETGKMPDRDAILSEYLRNFNILRDGWKSKGTSFIIEEMKPLCVTIGRDVRVNGVPARAIDIAEGGELIIEDETGVHNVLAGDVSVRGITDYI